METVIITLKSEVKNLESFINHNKNNGFLKEQIKSCETSIKKHLKAIDLLKNNINL